MSLYYTKKAIDCMAQHVKTFHEQAISECVADFGEPCQTCPHIKECNFDWLSVMHPLIQQSAVSISMERPAHLSTLGSDDNYHEQDKDNH
jgi:hypothetical protein